MSYTHNKACATCRRIRVEVGGSHHGRPSSRLWRLIEDYHFDKITLVDIAAKYKNDPTLKSIQSHANKHQMFEATDVATSKIQQLQRKSDDEKIKLILKSAIKADDMRGMMKQMFEEIMEDEVKRKEFLRKFKPSDAIKMINDEETLELKKVDTANELLKTMNQFASGATVIDLPDASVPDTPGPVETVEGEVVGRA